MVATVLTVYGIETIMYHRHYQLVQLQQCLPFTVLKLVKDIESFGIKIIALQQCLPFTVLKLP